MKKIVLFFALILTSVFSYGQSQREFLRLGLSYANAELPMTDGFFTLEKIDLVDDDIVMYATIDETVISLDDFSSSFSQNKAAVVSNALGSDEAVAELINVFDVGFKYVVSGNSSKDQVVFEISSEELKAASNERVDNQDLINMLLAESDEEMPMDLGFGMQITRIYMENGYLCYDVKVDESIMTLGLLKFMEKDYVDAAVSYAKNVTNPDEQMMFEYLRENNFGMKYVFSSDTSSEIVTMTIAPELLK